MDEDDRRPEREVYLKRYLRVTGRHREAPRDPSLVSSGQAAIYRKEFCANRIHQLLKTVPEFFLSVGGFNIQFVEGCL